MKHFTFFPMPWRLWMMIMAVLLPAGAFADVTNGAYFVLSDNNSHITFYYYEEAEDDDNDWWESKGEQVFDRPAILKKEESMYSLDEYTDGLDPVVAKQVKTVTFDSSFKEARPTTTKNWFKGMTNLVNIENISYLNTENVQSMYNMFRECSSLKNVDVSGFVTSNVTTMENMFYECSSLEKLDLGSLDMSSIGLHTDWMIANCTSLKELTISNGMKKLSDNACQGVGKENSPCLLITPSDFAYGFDPTGDSFNWKAGTFCISDEEKNRPIGSIPYMLLSENQQQVTFYYDNKWKYSAGTIFGISEESIEYYKPYFGEDDEEYYQSEVPIAHLLGYQGLDKYVAAKVTKAVFDPSFASARPGHTVKWFAYMKKLKSIEGLQYLNTSNVWSMEYMFMECSSLTDIDLSNFNTEQVMSLSNLFSGCSSLKTIDLTHFKVNNVMKLDRMFFGCSSLTKLDVSHFDFDEIDKWWEEEGGEDDDEIEIFWLMDYFSANGVFQGCTNLKTLSISSDMQNMSEDACKGVGTTSAPCTLLIPDDFLLGVDSYGEFFVWREGVFCITDEMKKKDKVVTDYVIHDGNQLSFYHDNKRRARSGVLYEFEDYQWKNKRNRDLVDAVSFDVSFAEARPISTKGWFEGFDNLRNIEGLQNLNTSKVTNMANMFKGCSNLSMVDVSNFDTSKATDLTGMFQGCEGLEVMKIGDGMAKLTAGACQGVGTAQSPCLIVAPANFNFGTSTANDFTWKSGFFTISEERRPIEEYMVQSLNHKNVVFYRDKLKRVRKGTIYDLQNYQGMNSYYSSVENVTFDPSFAGARPTSTYKWFYNMYDLTKIDGLEYLNTSEVTNMSGMFYRCSSLNSLDLSHFDTSKVTDMSDMFWGCSSLNSLDLSHFDTSEVTDMSDMFWGCSSLNSLDLSHFDISNVEEEDGDNYGYDYGYWGTRRLLFGCKNLKELALSLSMSHLYENEYDEEEWFEGESACSGVGTKRSPCFLHVPEGFDFGDVNTASNPFQWKGGWFRLTDNSAYAQLSEDGKTMTFYFDKQKFTRMGTVYDLAEYNGLDEEQAKQVTKVVFDKSFAEARPDSTSQWFHGMTNLATIQGMEYLNTSKAISMYWMFHSCGSLKTIDLSHFNTSKVNNMRSMFYGCSGLKSIDLSNFDTSNVTTMYSMFYKCSGLTSLDLSKFDTSNVTTMYSMFYGCSGLTSLDLSKFDTSKVDNMRSMFNGCSRLASLDLSNFDTSNVTTMYNMFNECKKLTSLNLGSFDTSKVKSMYCMFNWCTSLASIDLGNFNTSEVTTMYAMFNECSSLSSIDVSSFNTSKVNSMYVMFNECRSLKTLNLSNFYISKSTNTNTMLDNCHNLDTLAICTTMGNLDNNACNKVGTADKPCVILAPWGFDFGMDTNQGTFNWKSGFFQLAPEGPYALVSEDERIMTFYFDNLVTARRGKTYDIGKYEGLDESDAAKVIKVVFDPSFANARPKSMKQWFKGMAKLSAVEGMENLNTSEVTDMYHLFHSCSSLTSIDLSHFDTSNVTTMYGMFYNCQSLTSLELSKFNTYKVNSMRAMFGGCSSLTSLDLSKFDTSRVTIMYNMFNGCSSLTSINLSNFNTSNVTTMYGMFNECKKLTSLNLGSFDTSKVKSMYCMFNWCTSLASIDLGNFNTSEVTTMYAMFNVCSSLSSIDVSSFNTSKVTNMYAMFNECTSLKTLNLSNFDMSKVTNSESMFDNCHSLETFHISSTMDNLNENACCRVGTPEKPCVLICPKDFNLENVIPERTFIWKSGYFTIPNGIAPTTIENADNTEQPIYNLQGVRVHSTKRGIYIRNGKKVMVK